MAVQNFECQIARAQITRYLAGEALSDDMIGQLEAHIGRCADCKDVLDQRRQALLSLVSPQSKKKAAPVSAVVEVEEPVASPKPTLSQRLIAKLPKPKSVEGKQPLTKPALYAGALALVLIGMSYFSHSLGSIMGPKASQTLTEQSPNEQATLSSKKQAIKVIASKPPKQTTTAIKAKIPPSLKPAPQVEVVSQPLKTETVKKPAHKRIRKSSSTPAKPQDQIRVYTD